MIYHQIKKKLIYAFCKLNLQFGWAYVEQINHYDQFTAMLKKNQ